MRGRERIDRRRFAKLDQLAGLAFDDIDVGQRAGICGPLKSIAEGKAAERQRRRVDGMPAQAAFER